jgi:hypothetical protein
VERSIRIVMGRKREKETSYKLQATSCELHDDI